MLFKRKSEVKEIDIQFYLKSKENKLKKLKTADIKDMSPHFICVNKKISDIQVTINNGLEVERVEKRNLYDLFQTEKKEALCINTSIVDSIIKFNSPNKINNIFDYNPNMSHLENFNTTTHKIHIKQKVNIKKSKPKKIIEKIPLKQLKRLISKEYIKQLVKELVEEERLSIKNIKFYGFFKAVPISKGIVYSWNRENLVCKIDKQVDLYLDAIAFIDVLSEEKFLKFVRR
ncbi:MAG: hypothetical protein ACQESN_03605 [Thermotogota bacterium]